MEKLQINLNKYKKKTNLAANEWQDRCAKVCDNLKVPKSKRSQFFKWFKRDRSKAESSFRYIEERGDIKTPWKYFCWLMTH